MAFKAELLRGKLKEAGKTRAFLSEVTGRTERTVSRWLNNGPYPKDKDIEKIATALGCNPREFDPSFAPDSLGSVAIHAQVSIASHNAFAMMNFRYGVNQREIIELAPILFSIVASYAMRIPADDESLAVEAHRRGLGSPLDWLDNPDSSGMTVSAMDRKAVERNRCFGLPAEPDREVSSRHLFCQALTRLAKASGERVNACNFVQPDPGKAPTAVGFIADSEIFENITGGDAKIQDGLLKGQVRLSPLLADLMNKKFSDGNAFRHALHRNLEKELEEYRKPLAELRKAGLVQYKAWCAFYADRHPNLAYEYEKIVAAHCHEDGWYPIDYSENDKIKFWTKPYLEERFIDETTLLEMQQKRANGECAQLHSDPIYRRFKELQSLRDKVRHEFNPDDPDISPYYDLDLKFEDFVEGSTQDDNENRPTINYKSSEGMVQ